MNLQSFCLPIDPIAVNILFVFVWSDITKHTGSCCDIMYLDYWSMSPKHDTYTHIHTPPLIPLYANDVPDPPYFGGVLLRYKFEISIKYFWSFWLNLCELLESILIL